MRLVHWGIHPAAFDGRSRATCITNGILVVVVIAQTLTMSDSGPGQLFGVEGMVVVITGGATGIYLISLKI